MHIIVLLRALPCPYVEDILTKNTELSSTYRVLLGYYFSDMLNWGYFVHVQTVCTRPLLGREGPGDEARGNLNLANT